jgi:hypothetical protein
MIGSRITPIVAYGADYRLPRYDDKDTDMPSVLHRRDRANRFAGVVCFGRSQEFHEAEKAEQEMADSGNGLIQTAIIC